MRLEFDAKIVVVLPYAEPLDESEECVLALNLEHRFNDSGSFDFHQPVPQRGIARVHIGELAYRSYKTPFPDLHGLKKDETTSAT